MSQGHSGNIIEIVIKRLVVGEARNFRRLEASRLLIMSNNIILFN